MDARHARVVVGRVLHGHFAVIVHAIDGAALILAVESADHSHMQITGRAALIGHRGVGGHVAYGCIIQHAGHDARAQRDVGFDRQGAGFIDDEILHDGARAEIAEQSEMFPGDGLVADQVEILDMVCIAVEFSSEGMTVRHDGIVGLAWPGCGGMPDGLEIIHSGEIDVGEEVDPAFFVLPLGGGFAGVHGRGKFDEIGRGADTGGIRIGLFGLLGIFRFNDRVFFTSGNGQRQKG